MTNEIEKFDPASLMNGVRDRIKATFVALIPEAHWEQLCQKEIDNFFSNKIAIDKSKQYTSEFQLICFEILTKWASEHLKNCLSSYISPHWNNVFDGVEPSDLLKDLLVKNAPEIFANVFANMASKVIYNLKNRGY